MTGLFLLILFGVVALSWWNLLQGKERARAVAGFACREHGLVLMDDTVVFESVNFRTKPVENQLGIQSFALIYGFEFAFRGILHTGGKVWIVPGNRTTVLIHTDNGDLIEEY